VVASLKWVGVEVVGVVEVVVVGGALLIVARRAEQT